MPRRTCGNIALLFTSVLAALAVIELMLALFLPQTIVDRQYHERYHPVMGWANKPNVSGAVGLNEITRTLTFHRSHNSAGLRSIREVQMSKREGIRRVLLVGDSYIWGYGVDDQQVISEVLQRRAGDQIEVLNGAVTGYGTDQELLWLINEGLAYQPDIVVLGFFPGNDVVEICTSLSYGYPKPYYTHEKGKLTVHNIPVPDTRQLRNKWTNEVNGTFERLKSWLRHNLHIYQMVVGRLNSVPTLRSFFVKTGLARRDDFALPPHVSRYQLTDHEKKMDLSDALIREMKRTAERAGAKFLLLFIPNKEFDPRHPVGYSPLVGYGKDAYDISANFSWNTQSSDYVHRLAKKEKIELLDMLPVVREAHRRGEQFYHAGAEDHHWSAAGHRIAAEVIADRLDKLGWLQ